MKRWTVAFAVLICALAARIASRRQPVVTASPPIVLRCGRLLGVRSGRLTANAVVVVAGDKITAVGANPPLPPGARIVDLRQATVLPGLIDAHTHITYHFDASGHFGSSSLELPGTTFDYAQRNARDTLRAGFTTIRNLGASGLIDLRLRNAINLGKAEGPRIFAAGQPLLADTMPLSTDSRITAIREFVRARAREGVDVIKIFEGVDANNQPLFSEAEVRAAVEEAARSGLRVAVHAHEAAAIKAAVLGECASIEHGTFADNAALHLIAAHHTALVPTLYLPTHYLGHRDQFDFDPGTWDFFRQLQAHNIDNARRARAAGVWIVAGSDAVAGVHGHNAMELVWLVKVGLTPAQAIHAATLDAATLLGQQDRLGTVEPGKLADMIAVPGDPLHDINILKDVKFVMKGGQIFKNEFTGSTPKPS